MIVTLMHDLRHLLRSWKRSPGLPLAVVLSVAFAVAAATTLFSVIDAVILRPLPYPEPERLVVLSRTSPQAAEASRASYEQFRYWREHNSVFEDVAAIRSQPYAVRTRSNESRSATAHVVSSSFFSVLRVRPTLGRVLDGDDDRPGAVPVVVLSERAWKSLFGGDAGVLGRTVTLVGRRQRLADHVIVGVVRDEARLHWLPAPSFFLPDIKDANHWDPGATREVIARLKPSISIQRAEADFTRVIQDGPFPLQASRGVAIPLHDAEFGEAWRRLQVLVIAVGLVLLLAFVNVAVLLVISGAERERELATRLALGATRGTLIRLLLAEQSALAVIGGVAGSALALLGIRLAVVLSPPDVPRIDTVSFDATTFAVGLGVAVLTGVVVAIPLLRIATRLTLVSSLAGATAIGLRRGHRLRRDGLLVAQLALVLALLVGATLALHSFWRMYNVELGFNMNRVVTAHVWLGGYELEPERLKNVQIRILQSVRDLPDVEEAALAAEVPTALTSYGVMLPDGRRVSARNNNVTADYFRLLGVPVLEGRLLTDADDEYAMVVSQSFATQFLPSQSAVGVTLPASGVNGPRVIVGVVGDTWTGRPELAPGRGRQGQAPAQTSVRPAATYSRLDTDRWRQSDVWLLVRPRPGANQIEDHIARTIQQVDPTIAPDISTLAEEAEVTRLPLRFYSVLLGMVACVALLLAGIGVVAAARQAAGERLREIGLRIALGAQPAAVRWLMLKRLLVLFLCAVGVGLCLGVVSARGLRAVLFEIEGTNVLALMTATALLGLIVMCGAYWPIRRASMVDPLKAMRID